MKINKMGGLVTPTNNLTGTRGTETDEVKL